MFIKIVHSGIHNSEQCFLILNQRHYFIAFIYIVAEGSAERDLISAGTDPAVKVTGFHTSAAIVAF